MTKMSREELENEIKKLQEQYDNYDNEDDDEKMWVRLPNGHEVCLQGSKLKAYKKKYGLDDEPELEVEVETEVEIKKPRRAAKKTVAPKKDEIEELEELEELEETPVETPRRFF